MSRLLTLRETAERLGYSIRTMQRHAAEGKPIPPAQRAGEGARATYLYDEDDINAYLATNQPE